MQAGPFALGALTRTENTIIGAAAAAPAWVRPLRAAERAAAASLSIGDAFLRHDNGTALWLGSVGGVAGRDWPADEGPGDATWIIEGAPGGGAGASLRSLNRPGERLACAAAGSQCAIARGSTAAFNASAAFTVHAPGLSGAAGSVSLESALFPGFYLSAFAAPANSSAWGAALALQRLAPGAAFASASSFARGAALWAPPVLTYVAETADGSAAGSRDLLLVPVADVVDEWYGIYLKVQAPAN